MDFMILDKEEEHRKYEKLKALQNKKLNLTKVRIMFTQKVIMATYL